MKKSSIGGQGVLDGVMMRSQRRAPWPSGRNPAKSSQKWENKVQGRRAFSTWPVVRGVVNFVEMMVNGMSVIMDAAKMAENGEEEYEPNKFEKYVAKKPEKAPWM